MYFLYSIAYSLGFLLMIPAFLLNRQKYASGFQQRLGNYPEVNPDERKVIWLHCVSVGETNAARPLVDKLVEEFPDHRLVISTTTKTGQDLANKIFADKADAIIYFPFDWKFSVRKALANYKPSLVLLMETEIWPRFIHEAKLFGAKVAIVNGRLSEKSFRRYSKVRSFISSVLTDIDLALMQGEQDASRVVAVGLSRDRASVTGNLKFDLEFEEPESALTEEIRERFGIDGERSLIVAASTHEPEEQWLLETYCSLAAGETKTRPRLLIAPRHPERFDSVAKLLREFRNEPDCEWNRYTFSLRSESQTDDDKNTDVIVLDSIGELRAAYPLAEIVFVGGSLIPHGGQSILEPAAAGKPIITGPYTQNFDEVVRVFKGNNAMVQLPETRQESVVDEIFLAVSDLLESEETRLTLGRNALAVMKANRGATDSTMNYLKSLV
jgi:3-deoxy-D-manno-octulosonic-acid transferase